MSRYEYGAPIAENDPIPMPAPDDLDTVAPPPGYEESFEISEIEEEEGLDGLGAPGEEATDYI